MNGAYTQPDLWEGWATEPPPADPQDEEKPVRLAYHRRRLWTVIDLPDINEYQP